MNKILPCLKYSSLNYQFSSDKSILCENCINKYSTNCKITNNQIKIFTVL